MALSEFEIKRYQLAKKQFLNKRRPHPDVRDKCDLGCRLNDETVEMFEVRPRWNDPNTYDEHCFAKTNYLKKEKNWQIYWMRHHEKWERYKTKGDVKTIEDVFNIIDLDEYGSFFG